MLLAAVPVVAYGLAYAYKVGYARRLRIPIEVVSLELSDVFLALPGLAALVLLVAVLQSATHDIGKPEPGDAWSPAGSVVHRLVGTPLWMSAAFAPFLLLYRVPWHGWIILVAFVLVFSALPDSLPALYTSLRGGSFVERFEADQQARRENRDPLISAIMRLGMDRVALLLLLAYLATLAYHAGSAYALYKHEFLVTTGASPHVVLATYGDTIVVAPFDPKTRIIGDERRIQRLSAERPLDAEWTETGRLDANPTTTTTTSTTPADPDSE